MGAFLKILLLLISLAHFLSVASCTLKKNKTSDPAKIIQEAEKKIHLTQYAEAEKDLKNLLSEYPKHARAKMVLASLYVHRAGLRIEDHIKLEEIINSKPSEDETVIEKSFLKDLSQNSDEILSQLGIALLELNRVLVQSKSWKEKLEQLPELDEIQATDLRKALTLLATLSTLTLESTTSKNWLAPEEKITEGMILYRAVIKIYFFKYLWIHNEFLPTADDMICQSPLQILKAKVEYLNSYVEDLLTDFALGLPDAKENTQKQLDNFKKATHQVLSWINSASSEEDSIAQIIADQGEGFKCDF